MNDLYRQQIEKPQLAESMLGDCAVACGCDSKLHRPIMFETLFGPGLLRACMKCGMVTCAELRGDDGRFTGEASMAYFQIDVAPEHLHWLAQWPRVTPQRQPSLWPMHQAWTRSTPLFLPATLRCRSSERLAAEEVVMRDDQHAMTTRERLRWCGGPSKAPPADLPPSFSGFAALWQDLQLTPQSDLQRLTARARDGSVIAAELLMQHADANTMLMNIIREGWLDAALLMLRTTTRPQHGLEEALIDLLNAVPMTAHSAVPDRIQTWARVELALIITAERHLDSTAMTTALRALMRKVARHDSTLVNCIRITLRELEQPVAP